MTKLNQIVALNEPKKTAANQFMTGHYQTMQKPAPFFGQEKKYEPKDEDGERFPDESHKVQLNVCEMLDEMKKAWSEMYDVVLTNDKGNAIAKADIKIGDEIILPQVPVSNLLWLQKQLDDWKSIISGIPTLPLSDSWVFDEGNNLYKTSPVKTHKTQKVDKPIVLYDATDKHPAQTQLITKDITIGHWTTTKTSSALPKSQVQKMLDNVNKLKEAVLKAREEANSTEIEQEKGGKELIKYIFTI